jgi:hypothetical protein
MGYIVIGPKSCPLSPFEQYPQVLQHGCCSTYCSALQIPSRFRIRKSLEARVTCESSCVGSSPPYIFFAEHAGGLHIILLIEEKSLYASKHTHS